MPGHRFTFMPRSVSWTTWGPLSAPTTSTFVPGPMTQNFPAPSSTTASTSGNPGYSIDSITGHAHSPGICGSNCLGNTSTANPLTTRTCSTRSALSRPSPTPPENSSDGTTPGPVEPAHLDGCARTARRASRSSPGFGPPPSTGPSMTRTHERDIFADPTDSDDWKMQRLNYRGASACAGDTGVSTERLTTDGSTTTRAQGPVRCAGSWWP